MLVDKRWGVSSVFLLLLLFPLSVVAQEEPDSLVSYDLSEIVIGGEVRHADAAQRLYRIGLAELAKQDKPDVAGVLSLLPSAHLQTNSRGETLVYVRAAGERQVAIFLDGAPLNIGWDNRVDLSMIPANVLGGITLERGAVSSAYGPNLVGGAVNLNSRSLSRNTSIREANIQFGEPNSRAAKLMFAKKKGKVSMLIGGTLSRSDGVRVPHDADLPFSQDGDIRTNSDKASSTVYGRWDLEDDHRSLGVTVFHADSEKGVAPESHVDPNVESVRYWRYPVWRNTMAIVNGASRVYPFHLFSTIWVSRFQQHISQYDSDSYDKATFRQEDLDISAGLRAVAEWKPKETTFRGIGFVSTTSHAQKDIELGISAPSSMPESTYRNVLYSVGAEIAIPNKLEGQWLVGASLDGMSTPDSFDKPAQPALLDWSLNFEADFRVSDRLQVILNGGSKARFPTLRELYGVALNRFVLNPDLKGERVWLGEAGLRRSGERTALELTGFVQRTVDAIDQENVIVDGVRKRKRVNLDGSRVWGIELSGAYRPTSRFSVDGNGTWLRPVALSEDSERHLTEKPEVMATLNVAFSLRPSLRVSSSIRHLGSAYGLMPNNDQVSLPRSTEVNVRVAKSHYFRENAVFVEAYIGADNVFDSLTLPQLGLPSAGRSARIGINLSH